MNEFQRLAGIIPAKQAPKSTIVESARIFNGKTQFESVVNVTFDTPIEFGDIKLNESMCIIRGTLQVTSAGDVNNLDITQIIDENTKIGYNIQNIKNIGEISKKIVEALEYGNMHDLNGRPVTKVPNCNVSLQCIHAMQGNMEELKGETLVKYTEWYNNGGKELIETNQIFIGDRVTKTICAVCGGLEYCVKAHIPGM
jgi:hypothetical protein